MHALKVHYRTVLTFAVASMLVVLASSHGTAQEPFSAPEEARIRELVRDYIMENPDVVLEALRAMEQRRRDETAARQREALVGMHDRLYLDDRSVAVGPTDTEAPNPVTLVEFFDYQCGFCKRVFPSVMQAMADDPALKVVFVELPILGPMSTYSARAALASKKQGRYFDLHRAIMNERGRLSEERVMQIAEGLGIDTIKLRADMEDPAILKHIQDNIELAQTLGIEGTPAMVIGRQLVPGAVGLDQLKELIAETRAQQG